MNIKMIGYIKSVQIECHLQDKQRLFYRSIIREKKTAKSPQTCKILNEL